MDTHGAINLSCCPWYVHKQKKGVIINKKRKAYVAFVCFFLYITARIKIFFKKKNSPIDTTRARNDGFRDRTHIVREWLSSLGPKAAQKFFFFKFLGNLGGVTVTSPFGHLLFRDGSNVAMLVFECRAPDENPSHPLYIFWYAFTDILIATCIYIYICVYLGRAVLCWENMHTMLG